MQIQGQVFLVTGGASGLGEAVSRLLVEHGAQVLIADINESQGQALAQTLGAAAHFMRCDVTSESEGRASVTAAMALGALRGLINCAGIARAEKTLSQNGPHGLDSFIQTLHVNLVGTFNMTRLAAEAMSTLAPRADGERGVIINTASAAAFEGQIGQAAYAASKGGIAAMTLPIARDLARVGIRCVTVAPGIFATPLLLSMPPEVQAALGQQVPFPARAGQPAEFAAMVCSIIQNLMLNGTTIRLDGALRMPPK